MSLKLWISVCREKLIRLEKNQKEIIYFCYYFGEIMSWENEAIEISRFVFINFLGSDVSRHRSQDKKRKYLETKKPNSHK